MLTIAGLGLVAAFSPVSVPSLRRERLGVNPVPSLNVTQFLGRWYQAYANAFVDGTFEQNNYCVTADYGLNSNGSISVFNRARIGAPDGPETQIKGYAVPTSTTGELTVYLQGVPAGAPYWVFGLGPATFGASGLYQYALVSDYFNLSLFVLARNVTEYMAVYDAEVQTALTAAGFTNAINKPTVTPQTNCTYWGA